MLTLPASANTHPVRKGELDILLSGVSRAGHTHLLEDLTDWENLAPYVGAILLDTPSLEWREAGGFISGAVRLEPGGGIEEGASGLRVALTGLAAPLVHTHLVADITDFNAQLPTRLLPLLSGTNTISWTGNAGSVASSVRLKTNGGLLADGNGIYVDLGSGATQAAPGNHTHVQLHDAVTLLSGSDTLDITLTGQQLGGEVKLDPLGGLTVLLSGVGANFGTGHNQIARGDHTHAGDHAAVTVTNTASLRLVLAGQHLSGSVPVDEAPGADRGRLGIGGSGLYVRLGMGANDAAAGNHVHTPATTSADGFLSAVDKAKLDLLTGGIVSVQTNAHFTRENPAVVGEYLLGTYDWQTRVYLASASARALCGTVNTTLELEVDGVLTGRTVLLPSGAALTPVEVEQSLFNLMVEPGSAIRWKITDGVSIGENHFEISLVTRLAASSIEPIILISGVNPHPLGGLVDTEDGLAVSILLPGSNIRGSNGQLQIWDTGDAGWRPITCENGQLGVGDIVT